MSRTRLLRAYASTVRRLLSPVFAPRQFEQTLNVAQFLQILHDLSTIARETSIRAGGASRSTRLRVDDGHNELEHSENVHAGLLAEEPSICLRGMSYSDTVMVSTLFRG